MDVMKYNALPLIDYKKGKLRAVRRRMVEKLFKYEWKALFPVVAICAGILLGLTLFICLFCRDGFQFLLQGDDSVEFPATTILTTALSILLYACALMVTIFVPFGVSIHRYHKNFFKEEGYLTFSIPASMEEHILAKHLSAMLCMVLSIIVSFLSVIIIALCMSGYIQTVPSTTQPSANPFSDFFLGLESFIVSVESFIALFTVSGALCCWAQKFKKKRQIVLRLFLAYIGIMVLETVYVFILELGVLNFFYTVAGAHVGNFLTILFYAGVVALSVWYELKILKKKLNLK